MRIWGLISGEQLDQQDCLSGDRRTAESDSYNRNPGYWILLIVCLKVPDLLSKKREHRKLLIKTENSVNLKCRFTIWWGFIRKSQDKWTVIKTDLLFVGHPLINKGPDGKQQETVCNMKKVHSMTYSKKGYFSGN